MSYIIPLIPRAMRREVYVVDCYYQDADGHTAHENRELTEVFPDLYYRCIDGGIEVYAGCDYRQVHETAYLIRCVDNVSEILTDAHKVIAQRGIAAAYGEDLVPCLYRYQAEAMRIGGQDQDIVDYILRYAN